MASRLLRLMLCLGVVLLVVPAGVKAATVGKFVQVEGRVDLLKGGKLPVTTAKVQQAVDQGDVVRTKAGSRAQIQFVDETVLTIGPSSRVAIEDYVFDADKGERSATIEIFRGLVQTVVKKIYQMEEPDFVVKTHTSVLGVRGTKWYTQLLPTSTDVYTEEAGQVAKLEYKPSPQAGLEVKNIFPEVKGKVILKAMQFTRVGMDMAPTIPVNITKEDLKYLQAWLNLESGTSSPTSQTPEGDNATSSGTDSQTPPTGGLSTVPTTTYGARGTGLVSPTYLPTTSNLDSPLQYVTSGLYVPPTVTGPMAASPSPSPTPTPTPQPQTYFFTQTWFGSFVFQSEYPFTQGTVEGWGWGERTGVLDGYYSAKYSHTRFPPSGGSFGQNFLPGTSTGSMEGSVTGILGQTLTGTMCFTGTTENGDFDYEGNVALEPSGSMVFNYSGTRTYGDGSDGGTTQEGVMTFLPGTYFKQSVPGASVRESSIPARWLATVRNNGVLSGTQEEGPNPGPFQASFRNNIWGRGLFQYPEEPEIRTVDITMEGVLSGSPEGVMTGAMTTRATGPEINPSEVGGPVWAYPNGTLVAELYGSTLLSPGRYEKEHGLYIQTSDPQAITFTAGFTGSIDPFESSPPYNTGTTTGRGFGFGLASGLGEGWYTGTLSGEATGPNGNFESTERREIFYHLAGVATQSGEGALSGQVFATGLSGNDVWLYSDPNNPGTVSIEPDFTANLTLQNRWKGATGSGPIFGTFTVNFSPIPGTYFEQVAGPGSLTYTSDPPYTQQFTQITGDTVITGTGNLGNFVISNLSGTTTVDNGAINVFPPTVVRPNSTIYTRGVIGPEGMGAMDLTVVDSVGWYRARGAANQISGANLQGMNLVDSAYGPNRVPIKRVLQYEQVSE